jgi:hypothetical protein
MSTIDLSNLKACIDDAQRAAQSTDSGPPEPDQFEPLIERLERATKKLPPLYREAVAQPFIAKLQSLGASGFRHILKRDPRRESTAGLMLDIAQAILQNGEDYLTVATDGFQEVVSDLYDGFLSAEDRRAVKPPDGGVIAPLVKWGAPDAGPYTWPVDATNTFGAEAGIVSLPPANAKRGLLAWAALGHETAGHDILDADFGLRGELAQAIETALRKAKAPAGLPEYWSSRIDETAADVMGILNMGPAAALGMIGYFRGLNAAWTGAATLGNQGAEDDPHPADVLRGFLAAATVRQLAFTLAGDWASAIEAETLKDVTAIVIEDRPLTTAVARRSAEIVATTLVSRKAESLEHHALGEIQNWHDGDETLVARLRGQLVSDKRLPAHYPDGVYAAHVVAAAVTGGLEKGAKIHHIFERLQTSLKSMHNDNPSWGPLYVAHRGDITRHLSRIRRAARPALLAPARVAGAAAGGKPTAIAGVEPNGGQGAATVSLAARRGSRGARMVAGPGARTKPVKERKR